MPTPTLDDLDRDPGCAATLSRKELADIYRHAARLEADLRALLLVPEPIRPVREDGEDRLLTAAEAAHRLGYTRDWLYRHADQLPFTVRVKGRRPRFSARGITRYLRQRQGQPQP